MAAVVRATPTPVKAPAPVAAARPAAAVARGPAVGLGDGRPIPADVRRRLEASFGANLGGVRVHAGPGPAAVAGAAGARAFAFGPRIVLGDGQRPDDLRLMAHEAAHVLQQQAAPVPQRWAVGGPPAVTLGPGGGAFQRWTPAGGDRFEGEANRAAEAVVSGERFTVAERTAGPAVQRLLGLDADVAGRALNSFADKANLIPGFRMFTLVLGVNPVNMAAVPRTAANVLRAVIELLPVGGLITRALDEYGILDDVGAWVERQIATLGLVGGSIKQALTAFIATIKLSDIADLGGVWERAKRILTEPIDRIKAFALGLVTGIAEFIKAAILTPLAKLAEGTRGWDLLVAVLGKNPITGAAVPRTAETLIPGFLKLIGQEEVWANMQRANAVPRAWAWFRGAMAGLMGFVNRLPELAAGAVKSLELLDLAPPLRAFVKVGAVFAGFFVEFVTWAGTAVWNLLEIVFDSVSPGAFGYVKKTGAALRDILKNPLPFVGNLVAAAKLGFVNFGTNFLTHLKAGLFDWLTGSLPGIYIPKSFDLREIVQFALSALGLTWANIRQKLVRATSEPAVKAMEGGFAVVVALVRDGPAAAWEQIKEQLGNLKATVLDGIIGFVVDAVVKKAIPKLIAMFIPGAGFISAILSIYETVMVFVKKLAKILQVMKAFVDSIVTIAAGNIAAAAGKVESVLAGLLALAINFLAGFAGLGNVADKLMGVLNKARTPIDKALDWLVGWIRKAADKFVNAAKAGVEKLLQWWKQKLKFAVGGESHELSFRGEERSAVLMLASDPRLLEDHLDDWNRKGKDVTRIRNLVADIKAAQKQPATEKNAKAITDLFNQVGALLPAVMPAENWGSQENPVYLEYPKPRLSAYEALVLGPHTEKALSQDKLKELLALSGKERNKVPRTFFGGALSDGQWGEWLAADRVVRAYKATEVKKLPLDADTIGIGPQFQVQVGTRFEYKPDTTPGGGKLRRLLSKYGYRGKKDGGDMDHVIEIQLVGRDAGDVVANLWPLAAEVNRHGLQLANRDVRLPGKPPEVKKLADAAKERKKKPLWVMIQKTA